MPSYPATLADSVRTAAAVGHLETTLPVVEATDASAGADLRRALAAHRARLCAEAARLSSGEVAALAQVLAGLAEGWLQPQTAAHLAGDLGDPPSAADILIQLETARLFYR